MPYMLLIAEPRGQRATRAQPEGEALYASMVAFARELAEQGTLIEAHALTSDDNVTRVQVRDGRTSVVDGPFSEAKEMIGGFFLVDCASRDEALAIAKRCPAAQWASVDVRETGPCFR
ncbi:YciI family protein [Paraburkholderia acidisoli]|uniref:Dehydrogenase n=1 Tax=Paraburkholderia acidisoli TaxID=2571748 RepID=A0A7Z2JI36_9BURK|nr:YciI family protein [Paraburkholderia acidisoli]QGZ66502.1 dehydrogenase [Paraburkholderia acidisoli]